MPFNDHRIPEIGDKEPLPPWSGMGSPKGGWMSDTFRNQPQFPVPSRPEVPRSEELFHKLEFKRMQDQSKQRDIEDMKKLKYPPNQKWMLDNRIAFDSPFRDAFGG